MGVGPDGRQPLLERASKATDYLTRAPVLVLALTRAVWTLVLALLGIVAALALLAGEVWAAFANADEPGTPPR